MRLGGKIVLAPANKGGLCGYIVAKSGGHRTLCCTVLASNLHRFTVAQVTPILEGTYPQKIRRKSCLGLRCAHVFTASAKDFVPGFFGGAKVTSWGT